MSPSISLYEPKLVDRWARRFRDFKVDEMIRQRREARKKRKKPLLPKRPRRPNEAA